MQHGATVRAALEWRALFRAMLHPDLLPRMEMRSGPERDYVVFAKTVPMPGSPADAERYLMWTDATVNSVRNMSVRSVLGSLVDYERGISEDEAGNRTAAAYHLHRFVNTYDRPPAAHRGLVEDAKKRLATVGASDTRMPKPVR